jgi:anhydro-N-acetylmuramic acid kinase
MPQQTAFATSEPMQTRRVVGCMTGTSLDGIDCALVEIEGRGLEMRPRFVRGTSSSLGELAPRLRALAEQKPMTAGEIARLARDFALLHAREVKTLLDDGSEGASGGAETMRRCDLIAVHGQTVFHQPPVSWQLFNPAVLAHETGIDVVTDLRAADLAAGGQGAPITPLADWVWLRSSTERRVILNLGGFANATVLPRDSGPDSIKDIRGMDICACNHILDGVARVALAKPYDKDGIAAMRGKVNFEARQELCDLLASQSSAGRSLGTGDEISGNDGWIERWSERLAPNDLCATACAAVGKTIVRAIRKGTEPGYKAFDRLILAGGGLKNIALRGAINTDSGVRLSIKKDTHSYQQSLPMDFREAIEMAILGALCQDRVPITLPSVTGGDGPKPLAGVWVFAG